MVVRWIEVAKVCILSPNHLFVEVECVVPHYVLLDLDVVGVLVDVEYRCPLYMAVVRVDVGDDTDILNVIVNMMAVVELEGVLFDCAAVDRVKMDHALHVRELVVEFVVVKRLLVRRGSPADIAADGREAHAWKRAQLRNFTSADLVISRLEVI